VKRPILPHWVSRISAIAEPTGPEEIFRLPGGDRSSFRELLDDLSATKVIFLGETHDQIEHHQIELKVLQGLLERGKDVIVGMEMFERFQQPVLDRWREGRLTEEEFLKEVKWDTTWGVAYHLYKPILDEVRNRRLKLLGLNIEIQLVRKVAGKGIEGLSPEDREKLPQMDLTDQHHRDYIASIFKSHQGGSAKKFETFYQAQCLWDEAMAETLSRFLRSQEAEGKTILVLAGGGHVVFNFGIPNRLYRRVPVSYQTLVLKEWKKEIEEDFVFVETTAPLANFLWITRPNPPEKKRPRIGVMLKVREDPKRIWTERVIPESPAEKADLFPGDQFIAVEGKEIKEVKDIHDALDQKGWGKEITFTILREGSKKEITVTLPPEE
jgi:uncharacterized iron-regulated protein